LPPKACRVTCRAPSIDWMASASPPLRSISMLASSPTLPVLYVALDLPDISIAVTGTPMIEPTSSLLRRAACPNASAVAWRSMAWAIAEPGTLLPAAALSLRNAASRLRP
jgi:hypothetical protein